jgi:1A family penicillin-binding protein
MGTVAATVRTAVTRFTITILLASAVLASGFLLVSRQVGGIVRAGSEDDKDTLMQLNQLSQRSLVLDRSGETLAILHAEENRSPVALDAVPDHVINAILDVEDASFYSHSGVNVRAAGRALFANVQSGEVRQGGSTITQQLVKNTLLTPEKDLERKVKEAVLAVRLEEQFSKDEILERYLNTVYFGAGAYGLQAAAETYYGVSVGDLSPGQAAFLAGVIRNPVGYDPTLGEENAEQARVRRDYALDRMVELDHLPEEEAERFKQEPVPDKRVPTPLAPDDFFVEEVKQELLDDPRLGDTPAARQNAVFKGGLRIYTSMDRRMQQAAEGAVAAGIPASWKGRFTGALLSIDPRSGFVRAMFAGEDFKSEQTNLATGRGGSGRQPGSSFKPFVLAAAFENGYGPQDTVDGTEPCKTVRKGRTPETYDPGNYEGSRGAVTTLTKATAASMNCAYIRLGLAVGLDKVADTAKRLGINANLTVDGGGFADSMPLGSMEVTPLEMASAYGTFANDGVHQKPTFVERVEDANGKVILDNHREGERRIEPQVARLINQALVQVVQSGTGTRARIPTRWVAGKTGTSNNAENVWFVGYTPQLSTAVWLGAPDGNVSMGRATGGTYAAPIWRNFTAEALKDEPAMGFTAPDPNLIPKRKMVTEDITTKGKGSYDTRKKTTTRKKATVRRRTTATTTKPTATTAPPSSDSGSTDSGGGETKPGPPSNDSDSSISTETQTDTG